MSKTWVTITSHAGHPAPGPDMDIVMVFGFLSMFLAFVFFLHQHRSRSAELGLAVCLLATSAYGFLTGVWPLGIVQLLCAGSMLRRWHRDRLPRAPRLIHSRERVWMPQAIAHRSRMTRMFGSL